MKLTSKKVKEYTEWRSGVELRHCPDAVAEACNEMMRKFNNEFNGELDAKDLMKLLFFNDPIPSYIHIVMVLTLQQVEIL